MLYNIIICDDNEKDLERITDMVKAYFHSKNVDYKIHKFSDYDDKYLKYIRSRPSLPIFLLDIETPSMCGTDIARIIRNLNVNYPIIYVTGYYKDYAFDALQVGNVLGYINKFQNTKNELTEKLDLVLAKNGINQFIQISTDNISYTLECNDINYFETSDSKNKIKINGNINYGDIHLSMSNLYEQLDSRFIKTNQSCIVNFDNVKEFHIKRKIIYFKDGTSTNLVARDFVAKNKAWLQEHHMDKIVYK